MTKEEVAFCNLVNNHVASSGYSVASLQLGTGAEHYTFSLKRLGDSEQRQKWFTVMTNDLLTSVSENLLSLTLRIDLSQNLL